MNQKRAYKPVGEEEQPVFLYELTVNGRRLAKGMEASLSRAVNHPAGRYRFSYAEPGRNGGEPILFFFGPVRRTKQKYRQTKPSDVKTVHVKTRERDDEEPI